MTRQWVWLAPINAQILDNRKSDRVRRIADLTCAKGRANVRAAFLSKAQQSARGRHLAADVVQDLYVEVSRALEHPRIISSTLRRSSKPRRMPRFMCTTAPAT